MEVIPYVWGGSSPSTSFDCQRLCELGNQSQRMECGTRLGAQGLCNICTPVSPEQAKPGDLVFSSAPTTPPGFHVGAVCGKFGDVALRRPISYTNLNSSYWQQHFIVTGVCLKRQKGVLTMAMNKLDRIEKDIEKPRARSRAAKAASGAGSGQRPNRKTCRSSSLCAAST